ncbi:hypothetical protein ALQ38_02187 [Pseudomonas marginalis pv. marginalis]|nr:hypothetical protein ALQ38_02187 [Pseudomonas marginalis pv. marginalis]
MWEGLAPDSGESINHAVTKTLQSGASPLPHLICIELKEPWLFQAGFNLLRQTRF